MSELSAERIRELVAKASPVSVEGGSVKDLHACMSLSEYLYNNALAIADALDERDRLRAQLAEAVRQIKETEKARKLACKVIVDISAQLAEAVRQNNKLRAMAKLTAMLIQPAGSDHKITLVGHNRFTSTLMLASRSLSESYTPDLHDEVAQAELAARDATIEGLRADLEICMEVLDRLAYPTTVGPAMLTHLCEAGQNEVRLRAEIAHDARRKTNEWKTTEKEIESGECERVVEARSRGNYQCDPCFMTCGKDVWCASCAARLRNDASGAMGGAQE